MEKQSYQEILLNDIRPSPFNPRKRFDGPKMVELIVSVKAQGVIEPVLVRPVEGPETPFELVAGERRWRAALAAAETNGGTTDARIPALVRELTDDQAFDLMTIENLQREDLNELEEAEGFAAYLKRKGSGSLEELAGRTGVSARYIRRRTAVLQLPKKVLTAWEKGKLSYSHLEQFLRIKDDKELLEDLIKYALQLDWSAREIKNNIERISPHLKKAAFDVAGAGCGNCRHNSDVQRQLFDLESEKKRCLKAACFKQKTNDWLLGNWEQSDYFRKFGTCGFRFKSGLNRTDFLAFNSWERGPWKACRSCEKFVTLIDDIGRINEEKACLDPDCCRQRRKSKKEEPATAGRSRVASEGPRVAWHGEFFREKFYRSAIPIRFEQMKTTLDPAGRLQQAGADEKKRRLELLALLKSNQNLHTWLAAKLGVEKGDDGYGWFGFSDEILFGYLTAMDYDRIESILEEATLQTIIQKKFGSTGRRLVADHLGIDLKSEFRIDEEYLQKKTKGEIIAIGETFGVFEQKCVQDFLFEALLKKRGKYKTCKKGELIRLFIESGADLAGVVPDEIIGD